MSQLPRRLGSELCPSFSSVEWVVPSTATDWKNRVKDSPIYEVFGRLSESISFGDCIGPTSINLACVGCMAVSSRNKSCSNRRLNSTMEEMNMEILTKHELLRETR